MNVGHETTTTQMIPDLKDVHFTNPESSACKDARASISVVTDEDHL
jgi:hypothetical protein